MNLSSSTTITPPTTILFTVPCMSEIAEHIVATSNDTIELGQIQWARFPDSFPNLLIKNPSQLQHHRVAFLCSLDKPDVMFEQLSLMYALPRYLCRDFQIFLPFFPTGTMERVSQPGEVATAKTLARLLSAVPHHTHGPSQITLFDIHALQNLFYFGDNVLIRSASCIPLLLAELEQHSDVSIAFPDDGAYKRYHHKFPNYEHIVCIKVRDGDQRQVSIKEGKATNRRVVIVDDLVMSGGTLLECAHVLKEAGASSVCCFVTHAIFPNDSYTRFIDASPQLIDTFYITDTHPTAQKLHGVAPFQVLTIAPIIRQIIGNTHDQFDG